MDNLCVDSALGLLRIIRQETDAIGVAVSFGKDSLATLDLCCRIFKRVEGYYLYRVKGLSIVDEWAREVYRRHRVRVRMYPHFDLVRCYRAALLQPHWKNLPKIAKVKMTDIENQFRADANIEWLAMGWRRSDSLSRALIIKACRGIDFKTRRIFPLRLWKRGDVFAYLDARGIPRPDGLGRKEQGGLDFDAAALERLKSRPEDWEKWLADFPLSEMQLRVPLTNAAKIKCDPATKGPDGPTSGSVARVESGPEESSQLGRSTTGRSGREDHL